MDYLSICCIARDEDPFLKEWLAYYAQLGVEHFYIFDNMSKTPIRKLLGSFADAAKLTIMEVEGQGVQIQAYNYCLREFGTRSRWIGFLDLDEFVCPLEDRDLRVMLSEYEQYAALAINWDIFSSSGHLQRPKGLVIRNYTEKVREIDAENNVLMKCFVDPSRVLKADNPHIFTYAPGEVCVSPEHAPLPGKTPYSFSPKLKVKINHYYYRSQEDYDLKVRKGRATMPGEGLRSMSPFYRQAGAKVEKETRIWRFMPQVKAMLAADRLSVKTCSVPENAPLEDLLKNAETLLEAGDYDAAAVCLCHAAILDKQNPRLWVLRTRAARLAGDMDRAERFIRQAMSLEESMEVFEERKALYLAQGQENEARMVDAHVLHRLQIKDF